MTETPEATILFGGDIHAGEGTAHVDEAIRRVAAGADLVVVNLESPLTEPGTPLGGKDLCLRSSPANLQVLRDLSVDVACLANNHMCDWGSEGLEATRKLLAGVGIACVGAGANRSEAERPAVLERCGLRIAIAAFGAEEIDTVAAGDGTFGCAAVERERLHRVAAALRDQADVAVMVLHWGYTNYHYPLPEHVELGRSLLDAGATLVVGHHPHVIQGYERRGRGAVLYSLGNLVFAQYVRGGKPSVLSRENRTGVLAEVRVAARSVASIRFVHTWQADLRGDVRMLDPGRAVRRDRFIARLCGPLERLDYAGFFRRYALRRIVWRALRWLNPARWRSLSPAYLGGVKVALRRIVGTRR